MRYTALYGHIHAISVETTEELIDYAHGAELCQLRATH